MKWRGVLATDVITANGVIKTMITNSPGILGTRANTECLEDRLGILLGDGKAAFGWRKSGVDLFLFFQSEHVPLIKSYSTTRDRTLATVLYLLLYGDWGPNRSSGSACCTLRMPPGWPHPRFCSYRTLPSRPQA